MNAVDTAVFGELTHHQPVFTTADVIKTTGGSPRLGDPITVGFGKGKG